MIEVAILMSIRPRWIVKIFNGEKHKELRSRFPKKYRGWIYMYCTKEDDLCRICKISKDRYICGKNFDIKDFPHLHSGYNGRGKVVGRFYCDNVAEYVNGGRWNDDDTFGNYDDYITDKVCEESCVSEDALFAHYNDLAFSAINITKLEIFDRPMELSEFRAVNKLGIPQYEFGDGTCDYRRIKRAPQSWCYVEENK